MGKRNSRRPSARWARRVSRDRFPIGQVSLRIGDARKLTLYLNVQNLLDHQPAIAPVPSGLPQTTNQAIYDAIGRMFRIGARFNF